MTSSYIRTDPLQKRNTQTEVSITAWCEHETDKPFHSVPRSHSKCSCCQVQSWAQRGVQGPSPIVRYLNTFCTHQLPSHNTTRAAQLTLTLHYLHISASQIFIFFSSSEIMRAGLCITAHKQTLDRLNALNESGFSAVLLPQHFSFPLPWHPMPLLLHF